MVYLVDSLWDCGGALLKDWPSLTSALLQDSSSCSAGQEMRAFSGHKFYLVKDLKSSTTSITCILVFSGFFHKVCAPLLELTVQSVCVGFTPAEQAVLVEILVGSVRQASEGPVLAGRSGAKKVSGGFSCMRDSSVNNTLTTHHS